MYKNGVSYVCYYLDGRFTVSSDETCEESGLPVQSQKVVMPGTCVEMLGIIIDSEKNVVTCI